MTIERGKGNLLTTNVDALVNTVNTEGIMGKGLALQFKKAFPETFQSYERASKAGEIVIGRMHIVRRLASPRYIINFPTKKHWRHPSKLQYISDGLRDLISQVRALGITSIAIPPLGCGNGGLAWSAVKPLIVEAFAVVPKVRVVLFEPGVTPSANEIIDRRKKPPLTPARSALLALMGRYTETDYDYELSLVEVQKLAYFLQEAGEPLRLSFRPYYYGPYADDLRKALRNLEGHYTLGLGDGQNSPDTPLKLLPHAVEAARKFLTTSVETKTRLERVTKLIEGFESPFGMELLGTVHWVMRSLPDPDDSDAVIEKVHSWSERKRQMKDGHIRAAWSRLREQRWAGDPQRL